MQLIAACCSDAEEACSLRQQSSMKRLRHGLHCEAESQPFSSRQGSACSREVAVKYGEERDDVEFSDENEDLRVSNDANMLTK